MGTGPGDRRGLQRVGAAGHAQPDAGRLHHRQDVVDVLREPGDRLVGDSAGAVAQRERRDRVGAGRPADAEVDPAGVGGLEQRELLGHHQRGVVGQHHAARADPDPRRRRGDQPDQHRRVGRGHRRHVVVLGQPVAVVAQLVGGPGQRQRRRERVGGRLVGAHRDQVQDGQVQRAHQGGTARGRAGYSAAAARRSRASLARLRTVVTPRMPMIATSESQIGISGAHSTWLAAVDERQLVLVHARAGSASRR